MVGGGRASGVPGMEDTRNDERRATTTTKEEGRREGRREGREEGRKGGREEGKNICVCRTILSTVLHYM